MNDSSSRFWLYSCLVYEQPRVREICLHFQEKFTVNVNVLLACLWSANEKYLPIDSATFEHLHDAISAWHAEQTIPLRAVRKRLKTFVKEQADPMLEEMYQSILALELNMEKVEQKLLESVLTQRDKTVGSVDEIAAQNLQSYFHHLNVELDPVSREYVECLRGAC